MKNMKIIQILAIIIAILHILECVGQTVGLVIFLPRQFDFGIVEISGVIVYLMIKACLTISSVGMGIVWFALFSSGFKSFTEEHEEMAMNMMTGVAIVLKNSFQAASEIKTVNKLLDNKFCIFC